MSKSPTDSPWRPPTIVVGRVGRAHGLDGAVYLDGHGGAVPLRAGLEVTVGGRPAVIAERRGTDIRPIVRFDLAADRSAVEALRGQDVEVAATALPPPARDADDYLHVDLIGCRVRAGECELGTVADVLVYPANDVLDVRPDGGGEPVLVPFAADVVHRVDVPARLIVIRDDFL
jgi:16S rRNA processing protein RimM